jgi:hypothetical protein
LIRADNNCRRKTQKEPRLPGAIAIAERPISEHQLSDLTATRMKKPTKAKAKPTAKIKDLKPKKNPQGGRKAGGKQQEY